MFDGQFPSHLPVAELLSRCQSLPSQWRRREISERNRCNLFGRHESRQLLADKQLNLSENCNPKSNMSTFGLTCLTSPKLVFLDHSWVKHKVQQVKHVDFLIDLFDLLCQLHEIAMANHTHGITHVKGFLRQSMDSRLRLTR